MKKKLKKEVNATKGNELLILTTAIILIVVAIIYTISRYAGGAFFDFCAGAIGWVVLGIGVAFVLVYMSQKD